MKVLLVNKYHYLRGGAERAYFDMAKMLEEAGHEVAFFSMHHMENEETPYSRYFVENAEYHDKKLSLGKKLLLAGRLVYSLEAKRKMRAILRDFQPDIVHVHNVYHQLSPSIFSPVKKAGIPLVMTLHDYKLVSPNYSLFVRGKIWEETGGWRCILDRAVHDSFLRSTLCAIETWTHRALGLYAQVDLFFSPSLFLKEKYYELGFRGEIRYLPNALLSKVALPVAVERDPNLFLFFGRLSSEKGVDQLLRAWPSVRSPYRLKIVGEGPEKEALMKLAQELGIRERIEFAGALYGIHLERAKAEAEAVILPSRWYENMPYALLESLQAGSVVIASRLGGMAERIQHGVNGFLFDPENTEELAWLMNDLVKLDLEKTREAARESVDDMAPAYVLAELVSAYEELLSHKRIV